MDLFNIEAEQAILGSIILNNNKIEQLDILEPKHFYLPAHEKLFKHLRNCIQNEEKRQDSVTLKTYFKLEKSMVTMPEDYLSQLLLAAGQVSVLISLKDYAKDLIVLWQKRELFNAIKEINEADTLSEIKNQLNAKFDALETETEDLPNSAEFLMQDFIFRKVEQKEKGELIKTGFQKLDKVTGGFYPANLVILGGKTSMGKSAVGLNIAKNIAKEIPTYLLSIEMKNDEVMGRFLMDEASVNGYRLRDCDLKPMEEQAALIAKNNFKSKLYVEDKAGWNVAKIHNRVKQLVKKLKIKVVIIDYLQKIAPSNPKESRERQIGGIAEDLKTMAKKLDVVVIVLCQMSRENEKRQNKRPLLSDLRDSGSIEQEADVVLFVHRDDYYLEKEAEPEYSPNYSRWLETYNRVKGKALVIVAKNRNGQVGESEMNFDKEFQRFTEIN